MSSVENLVHMLAEGHRQLGTLLTTLLSLTGSRDLVNGLPASKKVTDDAQHRQRWMCENKEED